MPCSYTAQVHEYPAPLKGRAGRGPTRRDAAPHLGLPSSDRASFTLTSSTSPYLRKTQAQGAAEYPHRPTNNSMPQLTA
jgi:hypothetical protein